MILFVAAFWAGAQNALAGGGSFITLPALMLTGMDAQAANITSTIALFPAQVASGWTGRRQVADLAALSFRLLVVISLVGGALGAILLLVTPPTFFAHLVPFLVLFATAVFAWGSFAPRAQSAARPRQAARTEPAARPQPKMPSATPPNQAGRLNRFGAGGVQFLISVYGGYFGGGIGFLMLAALTSAGLMMRSAGATKNVLAGVMNASAVAIFLCSSHVRWLPASVCGAGAVGGGIIGALLLKRVSDKPLRVLVILIGVALTVGLFLRAGGSI